MQFNEPWQGKKLDESHYGLLDKYENQILSWYGDPENTELIDRMAVCLNFCAGFSNEDLEGLNSLRLVKAMADSSGEMLLEVQQECGEANNLLKKVYKSDPSICSCEVEDYLIEKGLI